MSFNNLDFEEFVEVLDTVNENNYHNFSTLKKALKSLYGKISETAFDEILNHLYSEYGIESDADFLDNINYNDFYTFLNSLTDE